MWKKHTIMRFSDFPPLAGYFVALLLTIVAEADEDCSLTTVKPFALSLANCTISSSHVDSWGISVSVGSPAQQICLVPSTVVNNTLVVGQEVCQGSPLDQCTSRHGGLFSASSAGASFKTIDPPQELGWGGIIGPPFTVAGKTTLKLIYDVSVDNLPMAVLTEGQNYNTGHLGLDTNSEFLRLAVAENAAPAPAFGINAGSQSVSRPRDGNIVIGGYDSASVKGYFTTYNISNHSGDRGSRLCPLRVEIQRLVLRRPASEEVDLMSPSIFGENVAACIEP